MRTRRHRSSSDPMPISEGHRPVLLQECLQYLAIESGDIIVDATLGGAGHAKAMVANLGAGGVFLGIDADKDAIARARTALQDAKAKIILEEGNFRFLESYLGKHGIPKIEKALFDLGWSSFQLAAGRGFSFLRDEPLHMSYSDAPDALTAEVVVNQWAEESLADVIYGWGEERYSRQIAKAIVTARENARITTSKQLADVIWAAVPPAYRRGRLHPATKTFQAIRIAVNDELGALKDGIGAAFRHLSPGGRLAVISFHSVEDREVKNLMREWDRSGEGKRLTKSVVTPSREEVQANPRARSAKLRVIEKT